MFSNCTRVWTYTLRQLGKVKELLKISVVCSNSLLHEFGCQEESQIMERRQQSPISHRSCIERQSSLTVNVFGVAHLPRSQESV